MWNPSMENGAGSLADRFRGMAVDSNTAFGRLDSPNDNLMQVMKAVDAAETTIKQQVQEITKLQKKIWELENYKSDASNVLRPPVDGPRDAYEHVPEQYKAHRPVSPSVREEERVRWMANSSLDSQGTLVIHPNIMLGNNDPALQTPPEGQYFSQSSKPSGTLKVFTDGQAGVDNAGFSQMSSPSSRSLSPNRHHKEGEYDYRPNLSGHGAIQMPEISNPISLWKQDLFPKVREHEEEIVQLRKQLAEYSIKETQIRNEKYVLEKRIAYMRLAFDQQQQDLVDAASKALSYRQDIIEENIRLTYALQAAEQERSIFVSSLLPLLKEYDLQPHVLDAQSIVTNLKILIQHLREKLNFSEVKLKESQYQLAPWRSDVSNNSNFPPQSPSHSGRAQPTILGRSGLEIVPQPVYSHAQASISPSNAQQNQHAGSRGASSKNMDLDHLGRPPPASRNARAQDIPAQLGTQSDTHVARLREENLNRDLSFNDAISSTEMDDSDAVALQNERGSMVHWPTGSSPNLTPVQEDPNSSYSPNLPPVLEEPTSSFSEAAEDDPLPAIDGLQIAGEAYPGRKLLACGFSINGTTSCNFEWVRCLQDGSVNYIQGANQPNYLVTADDIDTYLAIEVVPLDNRKRKGELVKVFANDQRKITCDPEMQANIEKFFFNGQASFEVSLSAGCLDIFEPALLSIKREGYSIKCNEPRGAVVAEKFSPSNLVTITHGQETEFSILSSNGTEHLLRTADSSSLRDVIVLTIRLFIKRAIEKRKGRKRGLFFGK